MHKQRISSNSSNDSLWPADQLLITADISEAVDAVLHPKKQIKFLNEMTLFAGLGIFADSLAYSTSNGNTGWTAFRMGAVGHMAYHHWDMGQPNLLQLDVYGTGPLDEDNALNTISNFWIPIGMRAILAHRPAPSEKLDIHKLRDDLLCRSNNQEGLGPGDHLHLLVDQTGTIGPKSRRQDALNRAILELVFRLKMRCLTPLISRFNAYEGGFEYDAVVGITTSHIAFRLRGNDTCQSLSLDVFSCRNFRPTVVCRWLDSLCQQPDNRRIILYNRHPEGEFTDLSEKL
jgi:hypothetical protein